MPRARGVFSTKGGRKCVGMLIFKVQSWVGSASDRRWVWKKGPSFKSFIKRGNRRCEYCAEPYLYSGSFSSQINNAELSLIEHVLCACHCSKVLSHTPHSSRGMHYCHQPQQTRREAWSRSAIAHSHAIS